MNKVKIPKNFYENLCEFHAQKLAKKHNFSLKNARKITDDYLFSVYEVY